MTASCSCPARRPRRSSRWPRDDPRYRAAPGRTDPGRHLPTHPGTVPRLPRQTREHPLPELSRASAHSRRSHRAITTSSGPAIDQPSPGDGTSRPRHSPPWHQQAAAPRAETAAHAHDPRRSPPPRQSQSAHALVTGMGFNSVRVRLADLRKAPGSAGGSRGRVGQSPPRSDANTPLASNWRDGGSSRIGTPSGEMGGLRETLRRAGNAEYSRLPQPPACWVRAPRSSSSARC